MASSHTCVIAIEKNCSRFLYEWRGEVLISIWPKAKLKYEHAFNKTLKCNVHLTCSLFTRSLLGFHPRPHWGGFTTDGGFVPGPTKGGFATWPHWGGFVPRPAKEGLPHDPTEVALSLDSPRGLCHMILMGGGLCPCSLLMRLCHMIPLRGLCPWTQ